MIRLRSLLSLCLVMSLSGSVCAQSYEGPTIWKMLGISQGARRVRDGLFNRRGNRPRLERKPPLKPIADSEFLESEVAPLQAAAEIKQAEDLKPQKIKAIKYLAKIGCGCYDKEGKVSDALAASMDDCTEAVRLATVQAIAEAAQGQRCDQCGVSCCCKEKVLLQLAKLAYERDDKGCWVEPSQRVRAAAAEALRVCCPNQGPVEEIPPVVPEGEIEGAPEAGPGEVEGVESARFPATSPRWSMIGVSRHEPSLGVDLPQPQPGPDANHPTDIQTVEGALVWIDAKRGLAHFHIADSSLAVPNGTNVQVYRRMLNGDRRAIGHMVVVQSVPGGANVRVAGGHRLSQFRRGDLVMASAIPRPVEQTANLQHVGDGQERSGKQPAVHRVSGSPPSVMGQFLQME